MSISIFKIIFMSGMKKSILIEKFLIKQTLAQAPNKGKNSLEPFQTMAIANSLPMLILESANFSSEPEIHRAVGDL